MTQHESGAHEQLSTLISDEAERERQRTRIGYTAIFFCGLLLVGNLLFPSPSGLAVLGNIVLAVALLAFGLLTRRGLDRTWMHFVITILCTLLLLFLVFYTETDQGAVAFFLLAPPLAYLFHSGWISGIWCFLHLTSLLAALYVPGVISADVIVPYARRMFVFAFILSFGLSSIASYLGQRYRQRLANAKATISQLESLLSVCMFCRKVKQGEDWVSINTYLAAKSETTISHGVCPSCREERINEIQRAPQAEPA